MAGSYIRKEFVTMGPKTQRRLHICLFGWYIQVSLIRDFSLKTLTEGSPMKTIVK